MLEAARIATVVELIGRCLNAWESERKTPADITLHHYFRDNRFIGSKDRAGISELFYFIVRHLSALEWWCMQAGRVTPRLLVITALILHRGLSMTEVKMLFNGERFSEAPLIPEEEEFAKSVRKGKLMHKDMPEDVQHNVPHWMLDTLRSSLGESWSNDIIALNAEAPVDLRANTLLITRDELLALLIKEGFKVEACRLSPVGIRMQTRAPIFTSQYFKKGFFEMQDEGSQLVSLLADVKPGQRVIDFCAGAGGKTLSLAAEMKNKGRILAWDISEKRLDQMAERLRRAKVDNVQRHLLTSENDSYLRRHENTADAVIIDAPCTGSGTWRRNPDLKWRTTKNDLEEIISVQQKILHHASRLVKQGGHLLYITCSIFAQENERQIETFLSQSKKFRVVTDSEICFKLIPRTAEHDGMVNLRPHKDGTDGFFAALLRRVE